MVFVYLRNLLIISVYYFPALLNDLIKYFCVIENKRIYHNSIFHLQKIESVSKNVRYAEIFEW